MPLASDSWGIIPSTELLHQCAGQVMNKRNACLRLCQALQFISAVHGLLPLRLGRQPYW